MRTVLTDARRGHPGLFAFAVAMAALVPVLAVLAAVDPRTLLGAPLWFKPLKFAISLALYAGTLAWMLGRLRDRPLRRTGWILTTAATVEMMIIVGQAAAGHRSHYNVDTRLDAALWAAMSVTIVVLWLATLAVALRFLRERGGSPVVTSAVRLGLVVALVGMAEGMLMARAGAHTVGLPDGGPGLPLLGWSSTGGDLRIAHFVGMHALQGLPLAAAGLLAVRGLDDATRVGLLRVGAAGWAGAVVLLTWQALRGQPLLAPDAPTLAVAGALALGTAVAVATVLARRPTPALAV